MKLKVAWKSIKKYLDDANEGLDMAFDQLLQELNVTEENYLLAVRSSIKTAAIFLKRNQMKLTVNNYNPACLLAWRANMDIQFVLDVYACAVYIDNYISKGQKGMSGLLREACNEAHNGNSSIKQQVRDIGPFHLISTPPLWTRFSGGWGKIENFLGVVSIKYENFLGVVSTKYENFSGVVSTKLVKISEGCC